MAAARGTSRPFGLGSPSGKEVTVGDSAMGGPKGATGARVGRPPGAPPAARLSGRAPSPLGAQTPAPRPAPRDRAAPGTPQPGPHCQAPRLVAYLRSRPGRAAESPAPRRDSRAPGSGARPHPQPPAAAGGGWGATSSPGGGGGGADHVGPRGGHWFPRRHRAVASGRGSGRGWGGRRPRAPRPPPAPAGRASPQRRLQTANPFFSSLAKETDPPDTSAPLDQLSLQLLRFQNSSNPCTPISEASLSISIPTPYSLGPSDQPPDPGSRVGRGGRC